MAAFRPEFERALALLARAFDEMERLEYGRPVIVGGAAVEFWTGGAVTSGDIDLVTARDAELEAILINQFGFERPSGAGKLIRGLIHSELEIGVEIVSRSLYEGRSDRERIVLVDMGQGKFQIVSVEDIIADRVGQYNSSPQGVPEMRDQAVKTFLLADDIDRTYLDRRIRDESGGDLSLEDLLAWVASDARNDV